MTSTLYRGGVIHSATDPFAEALLVDDGVIAWIGADDTADGLAARADRVVDLDGALVAPGFVDAHVHLFETGLALAGTDLSVTAGVTSLASALDAVAAAAAAATGDEVVLAFGWDERAWPEGRPPTAGELDAAAGGREVYAARADVHSAVVSTALARRAGLEGRPGWAESGWVTGEAHHVARDVARQVSPARRTALYRAALDAAARQGIVSVHEMSAPHIDTRAGLREVLDLTRDAGGALPHVVGYRGELCASVDDARALLADVPGLAGIAGDLNVDGSIGSRTAALRQPYQDAPGERGALYLSAEQVANHLSAVAAAGTQGGFHVIGDRAMDELVLGLKAAAEVHGAASVRAGRHRVEHALFVDATALATLLLFGVSLSVQPAFDAAWGGPDGTYAARVGATRAAGLSPFADLAGAGVPVAFGSDAPVTRLDPWAGVLAAMSHADPDQRVSARAAFRAHTRGGWRIAGLDHSGAGQLRVGAPAHLAVWRAEHLVVQGTPGRSVSSWSTDARAGSPLLPELGGDAPRPTCLQTVRDGVVLFDTFA
ncbi:amidohydrolase [Cellulosimicrobium marinum]|uniref:amidohydrolase n=1 Tax=Cellulosimicrobium marinum TaxID=1638992 RepID=UPI001E4993EC|nr:amidohydrolase family protein [Cellulosimicrobium marinum]MCB7137515.1 amidohydrolase family protein [Cellulosimicrobium marinum]